MPDFAIVPRYCISSSLSMPIPLSLTDRVLASASAVIIIFGAAFSASSVSLRHSIRLLSSASEAFEISSRKNISLLE